MSNDMDIKDIRIKIDSIDDDIIRLFSERMKLSEQVAKYKREHNLPVLNEVREQEILADVKEKAGEYGKYAERLFITLFELSKERQIELLKRTEG